MRSRASGSVCDAVPLHRFDNPMYTFHFKSDAPIELDALFFVGDQHQARAVFCVEAVVYDCGQQLALSARVCCRGCVSVWRLSLWPCTTCPSTSLPADLPSFVSQLSIVR